MKSKTISIAAGMLVIIAAIAGVATSVQSQSQPDIVRGEYLVKDALLCVDCHGKNLKGAQIPFSVSDPKIPFVKAAPGITGGNLKKLGYEKKDLVFVLQNHKRPNGGPLFPPMPPYKLNKQDAEDTAAYLFGLK